MRSLGDPRHLHAFLSWGPERVRNQLFARDAAKGGNLRQMLHRNRLPLRYSTRLDVADFCQVTEAATFGLEICCELFHGANLSPTEVSVKLIFSV